MRKLRAARLKQPKHSTVTRAYQFLIETPLERSQKLFNTLNPCGELRNLLALERERNRHEQRSVREAGGIPQYLTKNAQYRTVSELARSDPRFSHIHSQVLQNVADRIDAGNKRWLEALSEGRAQVKPPRPIDLKRYRSFTYTQYGSSAHLHRGVLHLSKLGDFRVHDYRKMRGRPKTVTIAFKHGRWWVIISCEIQVKDVCRSLDVVAHLPDTGIDPGLTALATTAQGEIHDPPKALKAALGDLRHEQRKLSRKFEARKVAFGLENVRLRDAGAASLATLREFATSNRLKTQIKRVARCHTRVHRVRDHHQKRLARQLEGQYRRVAVEEHGVKFMFANRRTARAAADRAIHAFKGHIQSAMGEARYAATPNFRPGIGGNSQSCLCGAKVPKTLKDRVHQCQACGLTAPRDQVSANIVMGIAFGHTQLQPDTGQVFVRRGGAQADTTIVASRECERTSEAPAKRHPSTSRGKRPTAGAKATAAVNTPRHRGRKSSLRGATQPPAA
jgi:putative transposase